MAAKKSSNKKRKSSRGGSMMSMRAGFQNMAGSGGKRKRKKELTFWNVLAWVVGVALIGVLIWSMRT